MLISYDRPPAITTTTALSLSETLTDQGVIAFWQSREQLVTVGGPLHSVHRAMARAKAEQLPDPSPSARHRVETIVRALGLRTLAPEIDVTEEQGFLLEWIVARDRRLAVAVDRRGMVSWSLLIGVARRRGTGPLSDDLLERLGDELTSLTN